MATAGEASALFGAEDSAADPFTLGPLSAETEQPAAGHDLFGEHDVHSATDLFGSSTGDDLTFQAQSEAQDQASYEYAGSENTWSAHETQYSTGYSDPAQYAPAQDNTYSQQSAAQGYDSQQGQWAGYEPQQYNPPVNGSYGGYPHTPSYQNTSYATTNAYAPAAPATTAPYASYAPPSHDTNAYNSTAASAPAPAAYDPYKPAITNNVAPPSQAAYAPYNPSHPAVQQSPYSVPVALEQPSYAYVPPPATTSLLVPPVEPAQPARSAAAAEAYRPKTFNAYDPPLPPPKPAARRTPAPVWSGSPAQAPYALPTSPPAGRAPPATLPPPPHRAPSLLPPPPRTGSAFSDYAPPPVRSPLAAVHRSTPPPPPRAAVPPAAPPPSKAFSPPPRAPSATQYALPSQAAGHAYQPNGHAFHAAEPPSGVQAPHLPPPPPSAVAASYQPIAQPPAIEQHHVEHEVHAAPLTAVPEALSEPQTSQDSFDPEGGVFDAGEDFWGEEGQQQAVDHPSEPVELPQSVHEGHAEELPVQNHAGVHAEAEQPPAGDDAKAGVFEPSASNTEMSWPNEFNASQNASAASSPPRMKSPPAPLPPKPAAEPYDPYNPSRVPTHQSSPRAQTPAERTKSPGNASIRSWSSSQRVSLDQDRSSTASSPYAPPPPRIPAKESPVVSAYDPYNPAVNHIQRTGSPSSFSLRSVGSQSQDIPARDPYAPTTSSIRSRSSTNGSVFSHGVSSPEDPYAPARQRQASVESSSYSSFSALRSYGESTSSVTSVGPAQVISLSAPTHTPYAPSPSLLGSNDPLGRTSVRVPVISFGCGGRLVTCFHGNSALNTGFDVAMSSRASSIVHVRPLHTAIPQSALETSSAAYPGPLFADPGSPTTTLVRTGVSTQTKNKKARVVKYLEERAEEMSQGIGYLHQGSVEGFRAEAKLAMLKLLKVMVENDGKLSGSPQIDSDVRAALVPHLGTGDAASEALHVPALASSYPGHGSALSPDDATISVHTLRSSQLNKIQQFLLRGDRRAAYQYAADEKLWAHAMVIASSVDKEAWKEVVTEFLRAELSGKESALGPLHAMDSKSAQSDGREPLKVAYSLFAGQGSASVQELLPPKPLGSMTSLHAIAPVASTSTPMTASFLPPMPPMVLPKDVLAKWSETAAMIMCSNMTTESSSALTALGDQLAANNWIEAAHVCYLLSPQTSLIGGLGSPSGRVVLFGSASPQVQPNFWKDQDPIIFSEIVEFALSLATPTKGQEPFPGLPHLQPYRLIRAAWLAELGHIDHANRYCDAISNSLNRPSPYLNAIFGEQLKGLIDRLTAAPVLDKSGSWAKVTRPSLDKIGGWFERGFTNFITGEADSPKPVDQHGKEPTFDGPFTHYSTISSVASSAAPSPQMSTVNLADVPNSAPFRTGSAAGLRPAAGSQIARASSAVDYLRRKPSPVPRVSSASAMSSSFGDLPPRSQNQSPYGYGYVPDVTPRTDRSGLSNEVGVDDQVDTPSGPPLGTWWGDSGAPTPTAASFHHQPPPQSAEASSDGFISLMDDVPSPYAATPSYGNGGQHMDDVDDDDDLGLGNSTRKPQAKAGSPTEAENKPAAQATKPEAAKEAEKPAAGGSGWFSISKLWKRNDSMPGPVKANLGDSNNFYYDKELKRWVNKNAGADAAPPPPPSAPPRAQTASPSTATFRSTAAPPTPGTPPVRPATAIDLTDGPPKKPPMRVRSNLVPSEASSAPNTPASAGMPPPPRPASSMDPPGLDGLPTGGARARPAAKRNARSRYVDVFQENAS
ncbi:Sec23-binding domain of Sec16-domain-containing protein [Phanerochaete sordida]|uniref:Protein transport protein sec16 n=1 Tax=Phanerochaete sordida TaxID=48140 RepID=A0A9P3LD27_9APHY|nr:Sec23-binding domain of Sec16-domain-containing protein [Phanerochaete sordida]